MKFQRRAIIQRGYDYFKEGRVTKVAAAPEENPNRFTYTARVKGSGRASYRVEITLDKELRLVGGSCDCPAFSQYDGPCKHMAAVAYQLGSHLGGSFDAAKSLIKLEAGAEEPADDEDGRFQQDMEELMELLQKSMPYRDFSDAVTTAETAPERKVKTATPRRVTSSAMSRYLETMETAQRAEEQSRAEAGQIRVEPTLVWDSGKLWVKLTVGRDRQYVVRSLKDFCRSIISGEELVFGKGLRFRGSVEAFDEESKPLIRYLLQQYQQIYELGQSQTFHTLDDLSDRLFTNQGRGMLLTGQAVDQFLELLSGRIFTFEKQERYRYNYNVRAGGARSRFEKGFSTRVKVMEGEPLLELEMEEAEDGVILRTEALPFRASGKNHMYLLGGQDSEILWKSDGAYMRTMGPFLDLLEQSEGEVFLSEKDLTRFCVNVYSHIRQWLDLRNDTGIFDRNMPWDMEGQLYLDSPQSGIITARLYGDYGPVRINLYNQKMYMGDDAPSANTEVSLSQGLSTGVKRNDVQEMRLCQLLEPYFTDIDLDGGMLVIRDDDDMAYEFLKRGQAELAPRLRMFVTDRFKRLMFPSKSRMSAGVSVGGDLLKVTFQLEGFPPEELADMLSAYRVKRKYYRLKSGAYVSMEDGQIKDAMELASGLQLTQEEMKAGQAVLPRYRALYVDEVAKRSASGLTLVRDSSFTSLVRAIRDVDEEKIPVPESLENILRDYQKTGYRWLKTMATLGFGGILADDMGLGKTLEVIALLLSAAEEAAAEQGMPLAEDMASTDILALVVCPASLVWNWGKELKRFAPGLSAVAISGTAAVRKKQLRQLTELPAEERRHTVILTSYDLLKRDVELYESLHFSYHIVDEAQYIKNFTTKNAKAVTALHSDHRFALTGTPIENRLSDLWSIFHFLMPGYLGSYMQFRQQYERPILEEGDEASAQLLQNQARPFILRRLKQKVLKELPEKVESVMFVPLEGEQQKLYMANLAKVKLEVGQTICEGGFESNKLQVLALLTRLRQLCCHPALCYENYTGGSAKLEACMELIHEAINGGHRILLFSQFTSMLALIEERLKQEKIGYYLLTGQTPKSARQHLVTYFNEGRVPIFLISLKAGGTGLNLTGADIVIHFDPWWNLAAQNQATDRVYRMGQENSVQVYKLVADGTIEEKILHLQEDKGNLADAVISENSAALGGLTDDQLRELFGV
ncbi:MAG: SNF2 helicase associated domain-containing protein [Firmicutes bacterium]|nr:SNF2 helicase associated domain-containing protein [Bacillota bacterium]